MSNFEFPIYLINRKSGHSMIQLVNTHSYIYLMAFIDRTNTYHLYQAVKEVPELVQGFLSSNDWEKTTAQNFKDLRKELFGFIRTQEINLQAKSGS